MDYDLLYDKLSATSSREGEEKEAAIYLIIECIQLLAESREYPVLVSFDLINAAIATAITADGNYGAETLADHMITMGTKLEKQVQRDRNGIPKSSNDDILVR